MSEWDDFREWNEPPRPKSREALMIGDARLRELLEEAWWRGRMSHAEIPLKSATGESLRAFCAKDVDELLLLRAGTPAPADTPEPPPNDTVTKP